MERCDAVMIGGGPAGSSCAWKLRQAGLDVLILDKQAFPRDKTCAGWVTPQVIQTLGLDPGQYSRGRVWQPITGFRTGLIGGKEIETRYGRTISYGIRRCEFDSYLLQRCGARCRLGQPLRSFEWRDRRWIVNGEIEAPLLIGAGGHFCPVARMLGARGQEGEPVVVAQEVEFPLAPHPLEQVAVEPQTPELFFCDDLRGYGWCFRKGGYLNIGLGRMDPQRLSAHVKEFCGFLRDRGKVCCDIPVRFSGHAYRLYERVQPKLLDDGVLLIGDSAGLAYPQSGEGIRPAVESGLLAAQVIVAAKGDYRPERLADYETRIVARFGAPRGQGPADWLPATWLQHLASRLMSMRWFARHVVMDRWFLHTHQPPLPV